MIGGIRERSGQYGNTELSDRKFPTSQVWAFFADLPYPTQLRPIYGVIQHQTKMSQRQSSFPQAFLSKKKRILENLAVPSESYDDLSPKGSIDVGVRDLIDEINEVNLQIMEMSGECNDSGGFK